ncbi:MAG: disulfide reductase [Desulfarculus sp.]|jgi:heterodisulfide reductase subunit B|nr:MAG: disulfide reductase [Desulfarculus sp.]
MRYALFLGCKIPYFVPQYEVSTRRVLAELGVELVDLEFNCCGYPFRHLYFSSYLLAAARALALAESQGLDILTPCKCCFGSFKRAQFLFRDKPALQQEVAAELAAEGLTYSGRCQVKHLQSVLYHDVGLEAIKGRVVRPFSKLNAAVMYGCHALRPSRVTGFDNPYAPVIVDRLVEATGAVSVPWEGKLQCCGAPLRGKNDEISLAMIRERLSECRTDGAEVLVVDCPYSQMQSDWAFDLMQPKDSREYVQGTVLYPQLLGLAMDLKPQELALELSTPDLSYLLSFLSDPQAKAAQARR